MPSGSPWPTGADCWRLAIGALAVAAIAIPLGAYAALRRSAHGPLQTPATVRSDR